jgi:hypothetical protein
MKRYCSHFFVEDEIGKGLLWNDKGHFVLRRHLCSHPLDLSGGSDLEKEGEGDS